MFDPCSRFETINLTFSISKGIAVIGAGNIVMTQFYQRPSVTTIIIIITDRSLKRTTTPHMILLHDSKGVNRNISDQITIRRLFE